MRAPFRRPRRARATARAQSSLYQVICVCVCVCTYIDIHTCKHTTARDQISFYLYFIYFFTF